MFKDLHIQFHIHNSLSIHIILEARASILPQNSSPHVVTSCIGNQVTLKCVAEGNPAPEFIWYKGKQAVSRSKVAEFDLNIAPSKFTRASHLTLTPNVKDDFGEYQCSATNTLGTTQQSTHRIVLNDKGNTFIESSEATLQVYHVL